MKKTFSIHIVMLLLFPLCAISAENNTEILVDPTKPANYSAPSREDALEGPLTLTGIFSYPDHRVAIINQQPVIVGDKIGDFSVSSITRNTVELHGSDGKKLVLILTPDIKEISR